MEFFRLSKQDFIHLKQIITEAFPSEAQGTYYAPPSKSKNPTGKLMSSYSNLRNILADVGIITREQSRSSHSLSVLETAELTTQEIPASEIVSAEEWEDEEKIKDAWGLTYERRQEDLKSNISTSDYMGRYPYLLQPKGYELVSYFFC